MITVPIVTAWYLMFPVTLWGLFTGFVVGYCTFAFGLALDDLGPSFRDRHEPITAYCYEPHYNRRDHGLPNYKFRPHVHVMAVNESGVPVCVVWEDSKS